MEFQQIIEKRKSIRTYADTPIPQEILGLPERFRVVGFLALGNVEK